MPRRPKPLSEPPLSAYATRPPLAKDPTRWSWRVVRHAGDKQHSIKGAGGRYTRREMKRRLLDLVEAEAWQATTPQPGRVVRTVADLLAHWSTEQAARQARGTLSDATVRSRATHTRGLCAGLGGVHLLDLDREHLQQWADGVDLAPRTLYVRLSVLRQAWQWGVSEGLELPALPAIELPPVLRDEHVLPHATPSPAEASALIAELPDGWPTVAAEILAGTGARVGEVASLTWADYRHGALWVRQKGGRGKARRRVLACSEHLQGILQSWRAAQPRRPAQAARILGVRPRTVYRLSQLLQEAGEEIGVPGVTAHGLRRMVSTRLLSAGVPPQVYEAQMGHRYSEALAVYAETTTADRARVAALLEPAEPVGVVVTLANVAE